MYGFPDELYKIEYKAKGSPEMAQLTKKLISKDVITDNSWGYDHGTWSILCKMFPKADIPVYQLSIDSNASADAHFKIGNDVIHYKRAGKPSELAFYTPEHFYPLLYVLGAAKEEDEVSVFNDTCTMGSLSMTSYLLSI